MKKFFSKKHTLQSGITFLELAIVMAIFSILGTTLLFNFRDFSSGIDAQNLAQDIALQIRDAQASSVNGRSVALGASQEPVDLNWTTSYGISFDVSGGEATSLIYFFDRDSDLDEIDRGYFDEDGSCGFDLSECLDEIVFTGNEVIEKLCVNELASGQLCTPTQEVEKLHVSYRRPSPQALIRTEGPELDTVSDATIYIRAGEDIYRRVVVSVTGQISVQLYEQE
jgi:type II secretory pathway pseudopilin PulG